MLLCISIIILCKISLCIQNQKNKFLLSRTRKTQLYLISWRMNTPLLCNFTWWGLFVPTKYSLQHSVTLPGVPSRPTPSQETKLVCTHAIINTEIHSFLASYSENPWEVRKMKPPKKAYLLSYFSLVYEIWKILPTHTPSCINIFVDPVG